MGIILSRRDTAAGFISTNPVLAVGEIGHETDTEASKIGDGVTAWVALPYSWADPTAASLNAAIVTGVGAGTIPEIKVGPKLRLTYDNGNAGQRVSLTGTDNTVMPYYQVVASTRTGTDGGSAVAGYQLHLGPDNGGGINREFFYLEAVGELHPDGPHYRMGSWASGTGAYRPLRIESGGTSAFIFDSAINAIQMFKRLQAFTSAQLIVDTSSEVGNQTGLSTVIYSDTPAYQASVFLGHSGGTRAAPVAPVVGSVLGTYQFGSMNGTSSVISAQIRAKPDQAWTFGSAQGTRIEFLIHPKDSASSVEVLRINDPAIDQAGMSVLVNKAGVKTLSVVTIGAADSAGTGYRQLRIQN